MKKTVVLGASSNPQRYSYLATQMLLENHIEVLPLGIKEGLCAGIPIITKWPVEEVGVDTVTLYLGPKNQPEHYAYILSINPRRIIFNPGTENPEFSALAVVQGIEVEEACTLVLLRTGQY